MRKALITVVMAGLAGQAFAQEPPPAEPEAAPKAAPQAPQQPDPKPAAKPLPAPANEIEKHVDALIDRAAQAFTGDPDRAWRVAYDLATLGPPAMPRLRAVAEADDAVRSLVALRALAELGEAGFAAGRACDWAAAGPLPLRVSAGQLVAALAARYRGTSGDGVRNALRDRLPLLLDETFEPRVKVPLAMALWHAGSDRRAVRELKALLKSEDAEVVAGAALGLGETGDIQAARSLLQRMRHEPTPRGRLARAILERETLERLVMMQSGDGRPLRIRGKGLELLEELRLLVNSHYPDAHEAKALIYAAARGIAASLDPATEFLEDSGAPSGEAQAGIGFQLALKDGLPTVVGLRAGGPAGLLGVRNGDRVLRIGGETVFGKSLPDLMDALSGEDGTTAKIEIYRDQRPRWQRWHKLEIPRRRLPAAPVVADLFPGGLGYVRVPAIAATTATELRDALARLREGGWAALVVDLRGTATGGRESLLAVAAELLGPGRLVFSSKGRSAQMAPPKDHRTPGDANGPVPPLPPMTVLVGPGTAGPGELLAAALRKHRQARLVGAKTFGNGQEVYAFPLTSAQGRAWLRMPVAIYTTAEGKAFHRTGLTPGVEVADRAHAGWIETERDAVRSAGHADREAARLLQEMEPAEARALAVSDRGDWRSYPGYSEWYGGLGTRADPEHLRSLLRAALRRRLAEAGMVAHADPREDPVLGRAVLMLLTTIGVEPGSLPLYAGLAPG